MLTNHQTEQRTKDFSIDAILSSIPYNWYSINKTTIFNDLEKTIIILNPMKKELKISQFKVILPSKILYTYTIITNPQETFTTILSQLDNSKITRIQTKTISEILESLLISKDSTNHHDIVQKIKAFQTNIDLVNNEEKEEPDMKRIVNNEEKEKEELDRQMNFFSRHTKFLHTKNKRIQLIPNDLEVIADKGIILNNKEQSLIIAFDGPSSSTLEIIQVIFNNSDCIIVKKTTINLNDQNLQYANIQTEVINSNTQQTFNDPYCQEFETFLNIGKKLTIEIEKILNPFYKKK